ncbi:MAG: hypothetical protein JXA68_07400 [Ignavibacteriales bacterium]|nr:hypothetical protein [Ignavibacteriales bacterium]
MMKRLFFIMSVFLLLGFISISAQQVKLSGTQTKGSAGSNAQLSCTPVTINKVMTINTISGDNAGFWITNGSSVIASYYNSNDQSAIGRRLNPGTYYVYPNLKKNQHQASVTLHLK